MVSGYGGANAEYPAEKPLSLVTVWDSHYPVRSNRNTEKKDYSKYTFLSI